MVRLGACALALALLPTAARGDVFGTRLDTHPRLTRVDALLLDVEEGRHAWIEQLTLLNDEPQIVWLRPFPAAPEASPGLEILPSLAEAAVRRPAHADELRSNPFGPSVLSLLTHRVRGETALAGPQPPPAARPLSVDAIGVFEGRAQTSTLTGEVSLPAALEGFLDRRDVELGNEQRGWLGHYLNLGWSVFAAALYDEAPSTEAPARIGPLRFEFSGAPPRYPLLGRTIGSGLRLTFYTLSGEPLLPGEVPSLTAEGGGASDVPEGTVAITFASPLDTRPELLFELREERGLPVDGDDVLTQAFFRPGVAQLDALSFVPPARALGAPRLPPPSTRGNLGDILLCLLLGLTPLVLTPESWIVRWAEGRAREHARRGGSRFGVKLWSLWALGVAAYWFFTLDDVARVAAIGPLLVGTIQLAIPFAEREPLPVRARFKTKKKKPGGGGQESPERPRPAAS